MRINAGMVVNNRMGVSSKGDVCRSSSTIGGFSCANYAMAVPRAATDRWRGFYKIVTLIHGGWFKVVAMRQTAGAFSIAGDRGCDARLAAIVGCRQLISKRLGRWIITNQN